MKERPIIFTNEHVEAILDGRKTQTRRVVKANDGIFSAKGLSFYLPSLLGCEAMHRNHKAIKAFMDLCPYGKQGDRLWVRENFVTESGLRKPSIHMPRAKSRATLVVKNVRVEHLNSITGSDCIAEGVSPNEHLGVHLEYRRIWDSINKGETSWLHNPWVWVIEFELASS